MNKPQGIFIRHKMDISPETLKALWNARKIAIHFGDTRKAREKGKWSKAYKTARKALDACCKNGAFVGADFREAGGEYVSKMLVGEIRRGTKIAEETLGSKHTYLTVQLKKKNAQVVSYVDYPVLLVGRYRGTIGGWPKVEKILKAILKGKNLHRKVQSLGTGQLEVLCYEYLRKKEELNFLLIRIGGNLRDIDIFGIGKQGRYVCAQVTQNGDFNEISKKIEKLRAFSNGRKDVTSFFFGPDKFSKKCKNKYRLINYVRIKKDVFENRTLRKIVDKMLCPNRKEP